MSESVVRDSDRIVPVLEFVRIACIFAIFFSVVSLAGCATLESNSQSYQSLPDPCAGKPRSGQDPLCGSPAL